jgi:hypothetical protein
MPCIPLVLTSACFMIPSIIGFFRRHMVDAVVTAALSCTSLWYHGTNSYLAYVIDKTYAHVYAIMYSCNSIVRLVRLHRVCDGVIVVFTAISIACYMKEGNTLNTQLHAGLHTSSIIAFSLYMLTKNVS